jgi:hypothetical protein
MYAAICAADLGLTASVVARWSQIPLTPEIGGRNHLIGALSMTSA